MGIDKKGQKSSNFQRKRPSFVLLSLRQCHWPWNCNFIASVKLRKVTSFSPFIHHSIPLHVGVVASHWPATQKTKEGPTKVKLLSQENATICPSLKSLPILFPLNGIPGSVQTAIQWNTEFKSNQKSVMQFFFCMHGWRINLVAVFIIWTSEYRFSKHPQCNQLLGLQPIKTQKYAWTGRVFCAQNRCLLFHHSELLAQPYSSPLILNKGQTVWIERWL